MTKRFTMVQQQVIDSPSVHLKIVGPSGSGKTTVLAQKIANLLAVEGQAGILVLTPTPSMSRGIQAWVGGIVGDLALGPRFTCLTEIALEQLRSNAEYLGLLRYFTTLDSREQRRWISLAVSRRFPHRSARDVIRMIGVLKASGVDPAGYQKFPEYDDETYQIYLEYQQYLTDTQALDVEEMIPLLVQLLRQRPSVATELAERYPCWVVDRLEDLTPMGLVLLNMMGPRLQKLIVAGDPWVSNHIPHNPVESFGTTFELKTLDLSHFSSDSPSRQIDTWANQSPIARTSHVSVVLTDGVDDEAEFVVRRVRQAIAEGYGLNDIAIIGPDDTYTVAIESALRASGLRFRTVFGQGGGTFAPIWELMAYLRVIFNPADRLALARLLALPPFQLDPLEIDIIVNHAHQARDGSVQFSDDGLAPATKQKVVALVELITHFRQSVDDAPSVLAGLLLDQVADDAGIREILEDENTIEAIEQRQAIDDLIMDITEAEWTVDQLMDAIVMAQLDDPQGESGSAVTVTSATAARGTTFLHVIACGVSFGPPTLSGYLASTRARSELVITIPKLDTIASCVAVSLQSTPKWALSRAAIVEALTQLGCTVTLVPEAKPALEWAVGESVCHHTWGEGTVSAVMGAGEHLMLDVLFDGQTRRVVVRYANLQRMS